MEDRSQLPDHLTPESTPIQDIQTGRPAAGRARHPHQSALAASPPMAGNNRWVIWLAVRLRIKRCRCEGQFKKKHNAGENKHEMPGVIWRPGLLLSSRSAKRKPPTEANSFEIDCGASYPPGRRHPPSRTALMLLGLDTEAAANERLTPDTAKAHRTHVHNMPCPQGPM